MADPKKVPKKPEPEGRPSEEQPPPPDAGEGVPGESVPFGEEKDKHCGKKYIPYEAAEAIYNQLITIKSTVDQLLEEAKEAKLKRQLDLVPVNTSDLMRGFQGAVSRANNAVRAGDEGGEDIERMAIKNLEVSISSPIVSDAHAEDPVIMLPNINSADGETAAVSLKFSVVSVPLAQKG